ncbi:General stress protein 14 [Pandoraea terrae]|uniref:General stress protein 14 n=2 Tax=Pandoraea terrae TaxID=1537710 RepID=A0A5E4TQM5_9BURK|nr:General stress protein 14 [Pandoraea terrae]
MTDTPAPRIYLLAAHPRWRDSRVNRRLLEVVRETPGVDVNDLYSTYPDYAIDVPAEQARLARADMLVLMHPIQWYSMPPLQKLWLDEVLSWGWAYGTHGHALAGKDVWLVGSTGGSAASYDTRSYNRYAFDAFLPPYEQTAVLCGMRFLPPLIFHGARSAGNAQLDAHVAIVADRLARYPQWCGHADPAAQPVCDVPPADRPATSA